MARVTTELLRETLRKTEADAAQKYAAFEQMRDGYSDSGVNLLEDREAFAKVEEAHKEYAALADQAAEQRNALAQMDGWDRPSQRPGVVAPIPHADAGGAPRRFGHRFTQSEAYRSLRESGAFNTDAGFLSMMTRGLERPILLMDKDELSMQIETLRAGATTVTGGGATSAGPFIQNDLQPGFVAYARKRPLIASLVAQATTDSDTVEYVRQTAVSTGAAETAEDVAAPESAITFETVTQPVLEVTHWVPVTLRAMADEGQIRAIVENDLAGGVLDRLDTQLMSGGGGADFTGIYNTSNIGTQALGGDTRLDALHKAITQIAVAAGVLDDADFIGMHPNDWQKVRLEKASDGHYIMGPPGMEGAKQAWGVPVVTSTVFTAGQPMVGAWQSSARLWLREGLSVNTGLDGNDFTKRRVSILAAMRVAFGVQRPGGFCGLTGF